MSATRPAIRIATRGSALALWQARRVATALAQHGVSTRLVEVSTTGDVDQRPFTSMPGSGFFTKAVQNAVLAGEADIAVHSYKDLPSVSTPRLTVAAMPERADPRDVLLSRPEAHVHDDADMPLRRGARVGTSAARRRAQLLLRRPDVTPAELRGNVPTRVAKLRDGAYDAIVVAKAGLDRLEMDLHGLHVTCLEPQVMMPAPAQGALAVEVLEDQPSLVELLRRLDDPVAHRAVNAERALMALFDAGCQLALGAYATTTGARGAISLAAWYDGRRVECVHGDPTEVARLAYRSLVGTESSGPGTGGAAEDDWENGVVRVEEQLEVGR